MFFTRTKPVEPQSAPARTAALIHEELTITEDSLPALAAKVQAAEMDASSAQRAYEGELLRFGRGERPEPDRGVLEAANVKVDVLHRVHGELCERVSSLRTELAAVDFEEAKAAGNDGIAELGNIAELKATELEAKLAEAKRIETELFDGKRLRNPSCVGE